MPTLRHFLLSKEIRLSLFDGSGGTVDFNITNIVNSNYNNNEFSISFLNRNEFSSSLPDGREAFLAITIFYIGYGSQFQFSDGWYVHRTGKKIVTLAPNNNFLPTVYSVTTNVEKIKNIFRLLSSTVNSIVVGLARNISSDETLGEIVNSNLLNINSSSDQYTFEFVSNINTTNVNGVYVKCITNSGDVYFYKKFQGGKTFNLNQGDRISASISLPVIGLIYV